MTIGVNKLSTIFYFKHETTPGTAVTPTSATDGYMAISDDFSGANDKDILESDLITSSIGRRKGQLGLQDTTASVSFELKGSGTEGTAPEFSDILETLFGSKTEYSTEYDTVAGSTTTVVEVDAGEGANFAVGQALLVKHSAFDYEIRPIKSIATDSLTVEPALDNAPAATTNLGKAVVYNVADSAHPQGTAGFYYGNEIVEKKAGCLIESGVIEIAVGQIVKFTANFQGLSNSVADGAAPHTPTYDATNGLVGLDVEAWVGSTKVDFPSCTITITDEIAELLSCKEVTGKVSNRAKKRMCDISMTQYMDDTSVANQTAFAALTDFAFVLNMGEKSSGDYQAGKCWNLYMPNCYFTSAPFGDEDDIMTEELEFAAHISTGIPEVYLSQV